MEEETGHVRALALAARGCHGGGEEVLPACELRPEVTGALHWYWEQGRDWEPRAGCEPAPRLVQASRGFCALPPSARHAANFVEPLGGKFVAADVQKPEVFGKAHQVARTVHVPDRGGQRAAVLRLVSCVDQVHQQIQRRGYQVLAYREPVRLGKLLYLGKNPQVPVVSFLHYYCRFRHFPSPTKKFSPKGASPLWNPPLNAKH